MASVSFMKCKAGTGIAASVLRHCDMAERLKHEHDNIHIDKTLTPDNLQGDRTYQQTLQALTNRLRELDSVPGSNKRKDRVEMFMLEVPIPQEYEKNAFRNIVLEKVYEMCGRENVLNWYFHADEVHEYMDNGKIKMSCTHIHIPVVPVVDGKLNGKQFSSSERMRGINNAIDEACRIQLGGPGFLKSDPMYDKHRRRVESMKAESYRQLTNAVENSEKRLAELDTQIGKKTQRAVDAAYEAQEAETRLREIREEMKALSRDPTFKEAQERAAAKQDLAMVKRDYPELFNADGRYISKRERDKNKKKT